MTNKLDDDRPSNRPLTSRQQQQLIRTTRRLAELLIEAAPLAERLNAAETPHRHRAALTELVGMRRYVTVLLSLEQMSCRPAWECAQRRRRLAAQRRPNRSRAGVGMSTTPIARSDKS